MLLLAVLRCWVVWGSSKTSPLRSSIEIPRLVSVYRSWLTLQKHPCTLASFPSLRRPENKQGTYACCLVSQLMWLPDIVILRNSLEDLCLNHLILTDWYGWHCMRVMQWCPTGQVKKLFWHGMSYNYRSDLWRLFFHPTQHHQQVHGWRVQEDVKVLTL